MKPVIHFIVGDFVLREELIKLFKKHNNIIVNNCTLQNINYEKTLYVSLTCCLLTSIMKTHNIYLERFKHNQELEDKIKEIGVYNNNKEILLPYHQYVTIRVGEDYILYTPIKYSSISTLPISHIYSAFQIIYKQSQECLINYIVIPLDGLITFNINDSINQYIAETIYKASHYFY